MIIYFIIFDMNKMNGFHFCPNKYKISILNINLNRNSKMLFFQNSTEINKNKHLNRLFNAHISGLISIIPFFLGNDQNDQYYFGKKIKILIRWTRLHFFLTILLI